MSPKRKTGAFEAMLTGRSDSAHAAHRMQLHITCRRPRLQRAKGVSPTAGLRLHARACLPHDMSTLHDHHVVHQTVARAGLVVEIMFLWKNSSIKTFFSARLRSYRFSQRTVFYGLIALLLIVFPADPAEGQATRRARGRRQSAR